MAKTIYECYRVNGNKAGFWVRRNIWDRDNTFFVKRIGLQTRGRLPANGRQRLAVWGDAYQGDLILKRNARLEYADTLSWLYLGSEKGMEKTASEGS
jgi:hypothetical protein